MENFSLYEFLYFVFIILLVAYIWLGARNIYSKEYTYFETRYLHYDDIQTGDVLLLSYSDPITIFNQGVICMKFIHAALCSREGTNLYVYEYSNYFDDKMGFLKLPFSEWIKYNKNCLIMINKLGIENDSKAKREQLSLKLNNFRNENMTDQDFSFMDYLGRYLMPTVEYQDFDNKRTDYACYELVLNMLKELDIIESLKATESYVTDDLIGMKKFNLNRKYNYDDYFIADVNSLKFISD
jgi:hypothetical protein